MPKKKPTKIPFTKVGGVNIPRLSQEIRDSDLDIGLIGIQSEGDNIVITMANVLNTPDKNTLQTVVTAHVNIPLEENVADLFQLVRSRDGLKCRSFGMSFSVAGGTTKQQDKNLVRLSRLASLILYTEGQVLGDQIDIRIRDNTNSGSDIAFLATDIPVDTQGKTVVKLDPDLVEEWDGALDLRIEYRSQGAQAVKTTALIERWTK